MSGDAVVKSQTSSQIPADDLRRMLTVANADSKNGTHVGVVGDTYTPYCSLAKTLLDSSV